MSWPVPRALFALLALLVAVAALPLTPAAAPPRTSPELLALAAASPAAQISVIIQQHPGTPSLAGHVAALGGAVTHDLRIIKALAATLPARAIAVLAADPAVRWISPDAAVVETGGPDPGMSIASMVNVYPRVVNAPAVWADGYQGSGVTVAVVDSGINNSNDIHSSRVVAHARTNSQTSSATDSYGHGTHVAGIIAGDGTTLNGKYIGIAPRVNLINVKVSDDTGMASAADVVAGLQWINEHREQHNIRVVNISLNSALPQSYNVDPMAAAAEILWFNGIVVVVSAGNLGGLGIFPPANDPFVITVGATDDRGTASRRDDVVAGFSAFGLTVDGFSKPDLVAPGRNIVSTMPNNGVALVKQHPDNVVDSKYFRMSGTSMSGPIVAAAAALLLQKEPQLSPDQVKHRLTATARTDWPAYSRLSAGAGYLDIQAALSATTTQSANTGLLQSQLLWASGSPQIWGSASWGSASWGSASWGSASWGSASWGSDYWGR